MDRMDIRQALGEATLGGTVTLGGWVRTVRGSKGGFSFITLNDGSCQDCIQVVADGKLDNYQSQIVHLTAGSSLLATGRLVESPASGQRVELAAERIVVLGHCDAESYPIQPKRHSYEFLRTVAHLRARTNTFGAVARVRSVLSAAIHEFFQSRGFIYIHTPIITASDCEGAGQLFRVTSLDPGNPPRDGEGKVDFSQDFFARSTFLTVSGQLEAETYACALGKVYTFGPTFRAENSNTPRHLAEFWMVEPEMAFCDLSGDAAMAEEFLKSILATVLERCRSELDFFNRNVDKTVLETLSGIIESDFARISYTEAVSLLESAGRSWAFPISWGADLQTEHERYLTEEAFKRPVIISDYPAGIKPFYMRANDDGKTVAAMDVLVPRIGEIIGGSQREERLDVLTERMIRGGMKTGDYAWYSDLRRYGTVPHAGFGLGLERTLLLATGMANIRDVIAFPRTPRSAEF